MHHLSLDSDDKTEIENFTCIAFLLDGVSLPVYQCGVRAEEKIILRVLKLVLEYSYAFTSRRRCPCSARAHAGGLVEVVAAQRLHRNQHTPALAVMLYSTDEVALFAEDFAMDVLKNGDER